MKLKTVDPEKYEGLSKGELKDKLVKKENATLAEQFSAAMGEQRIVRLGSAGASSLLTGILYEKWPALESIFGTPASLDHILAIGGALGAFIAKDEDVANASEGICYTGAMPLARGLGRMLGGFVVK